MHSDIAVKIELRNSPLVKLGSSLPVNLVNESG